MKNWLAEWLHSGRGIDLVFVVLSVQVAMVFLVARRRRALRQFLGWLLHLGAGLFVLLALRAALTGADVVWVALFLSLSFPPQLFDLWRHWRTERRRA